MSQCQEEGCLERATWGRRDQNQQPGQPFKGLWCPEHGKAQNKKDIIHNCTWGRRLRKGKSTTEVSYNKRDQGGRQGGGCCWVKISGEYWRQLTGNQPSYTVLVVSENQVTSGQCSIDGCSARATWGEKKEKQVPGQRFDGLWCPRHKPTDKEGELMHYQAWLKQAAACDTTVSTSL